MRPYEVVNVHPIFNRELRMDCHRSQPGSARARSADKGVATKFNIERASGCKGFVVGGNPCVTDPHEEQSEELAARKYAKSY